MKKVFTKAEMQSRKGCYSTEKLESLSFMTKKEITIESILYSEISLKDKSWFIRNSCELTISEKREFAIGCALAVLPIYENKYPNNDAPRKAIEAAKLYLSNEISLDDLNKFYKGAADAADSAADAAYTAAADAAYTAAADAAYTAAAAADTAYTADAAAAYAYAAADADDDINYKDLLLIFFKEFTKNY